jgi:hypothetical protein
MNRHLIYGGLGMLLAASWGALRLGAATVPPDKPHEHPKTAANAPLPSTVPTGRFALTVPIRDPFQIKSAQPVPAEPVADRMPAPAAAPLPTSAPPLDLQFTGRMVAPDGGVYIYALHREEILRLTSGTELSNGYRVEKITADSVEFTYPAFNATATLPIPPAPAFEVR